MNHTVILRSHGFVMGADEMLDIRAGELSNILTKHNIHIPNALRLSQGHDPDNYPIFGGSIYQSLRTRWKADIFWRLMFRDLNSPDLKWNSLPLLAACTGTMLPFDYIEWLLEHGADPLQPIQTQAIGNGQSSDTDVAERTCAHAVTFAIGATIRLQRWDTEEAGIEYVKGAKALNRRFLHLGLADACTCACSIEGCTLQVYQLKGLLDFRYADSNRLADPAHLSSSVTAYYEHFAATLSPGGHRDTIRFLTFSALGATHTCCFFNLMGCHYKVSPEDIEDVQDEEEAVLERLEQLVLYFEAELFALLKQWPDSPERLAEFWPGCWLPKMQEVLAELNGSDLSKEVKAGAEEAGVVWQESNNSPRVEEIDVYDERIWEHLMKKLDGIAPRK